jgi:hypothetical protein
MKILDIITEASTPTELPGELQTLVSNWIAKNPDKVRAAQPNLMTRYNPNMITLFKKVMIFAPLVQLNLNLYALEQIAVEPLAKFQTSSPAFAAYTQEQKDAYIKEARDLYYGVFAAQMVIPALGKWIRGGTPVVKEMFDLLEASFGKLGGKLGSIVKIFVAVGIEAFILFLGTPAGIAWMSDSIFMPIIRMSGSGVAWTWDKIWPVIQKYTGLPIDKINPNTQVAVDKTRSYGGLDNFKMMGSQEFKNRQDNMYNDIKNDPTLSYSRFK